MLAVRTFLMTVAVCFSASQPSQANAHQATRVSQDIQSSILSKLTGNWSVTGTVRGRSTATNASARWIVGGAFLELDFADRAGKSPYVAKVLFGADPSGLFTVHWIDGTGGGTSRTLGTGRPQGNVVTLSFPYPEGEFRDHLEYDPAKDSWRLLIKKGPPETETVFSDWTFSRETRPQD